MRHTQTMILSKKNKLESKLLPESDWDFQGVLDSWLPSCFTPAETEYSIFEEIL